METKKQQEQDVVWQSRPELKKIIDDYGNQSVYDFYRLNIPQKNSLHSQRKKELLSTINTLVKKSFGDTIAHTARDQIEQQSFVTTTDHHGPIVHPFFTNDKLIQSTINQEDGFQNLIVFAFGNISLNNSSFPRGLMMHTHNMYEARIRLKSLRHRQSPVWSIAPYDTDNLSRARHDLYEIKNQIPRYEVLHEIFERIYASPQILNLSSYGDQITHTNHALWRAVPGQEKKNLIYLQIEDIVNALILDHHIAQHTIIHDIVFNKKTRQAFETHFDGITGAFSKNPKKGTFLFWGVHNGKREALILNHDGLQLTREAYNLPLTPEAIAIAIKNREIIPSAALSFLVLNFYYNLTCAGGFTQIQQLADIKKAYHSLLRSIGAHNEITLTQNAMTNCFRGEIVLATLGEKQTTIPATSIDLILYNDRKSQTDLVKRMHQTTLSQALLPMMPEFYKIISRKMNLIAQQPMMKTRPTCPYCGANPTPHLLTWFSEAIEIALTPIEPYVLNKHIVWIMEKIGSFLLDIVLPFLHITKIVSYNTSPNAIAIERARVLWEEAERRNIVMKGWKVFGKNVDTYTAQFPNGRKIVFNGLPRPRVFKQEAPLWMDDKFILKQKLSHANIPVPQGKTFLHLHDALRYFETLQKPVIVKPRQGSRGRHTTTFIYTAEELREAFRIAKQICLWVIVEEHLVGAVYRGTVIGGKLIGVLGGAPPRIIGNGRDTIKELIRQKNLSKPDGVSDVRITPLLTSFLARNHYTLDTILPQGKEIDLSEKIGVSYGGTSFECTPQIHPETKKILEQAAAVVSDPILGFDFIIQDITKSPHEQKWGIIECNGLPFINLHHHPLIGKPVNVARAVWDLWSTEKQIS